MTEKNIHGYFFYKVSLKSMHECRNYQPFAEPTTSGKKYLKIAWAQGDNTGITGWGEMCEPLGQGGRLKERNVYKPKRNQT